MGRRMCGYVIRTGGVHGVGICVDGGQPDDADDDDAGSQEKGTVSEIYIYAIVGGKTDQNPTANIMDAAIFFLSESFNPATKGMGRTMIHRSKTMPMTAPLQVMAMSLTQKPSCSPS